jgi:signal recognition particle receptor subunit beta
MALINHEKKEINAKIVYYGPGLSGKTTNIKFIYEKMKPEFRGKLKVLNTNSGKMLFFDFMRPDQIGIQDYAVRFHIYTVPGEVSDFSIWKTVLKGTDGLVFVADSDAYKLPDNLQSYEKLKEYLDTLPGDTREFPCIFQCNKQDIEGATSLQEMKEMLHSTDLPMIPASTKKGEGILNTLSTIVKMVIQNLQNFPLGEKEEESAVVTETESPQAAYTGDNVLSSEPVSQSSPDLEEVNPYETFQEIAPERRFFFSPETGVTLGARDAEPTENIDTMETTAETCSMAENLQPIEAPLTEPPPIKEDSAFEPIQETPAAEEFSFTQETEQISNEIYLSEENTQYESTQLTETPSMEEESSFEPVREIVPEGEVFINSEMGLAVGGQLTADAAETEERLQESTDIDLSGEMELVAPGHFRLPVTIKFGQEIKTLTINLKLSVETP